MSAPPPDNPDCDAGGRILSSAPLGYHHSMRRIIASFILIASLAGPASAQADFSACLNGLRGPAAAKGVSAATFDTATRGLQPDMKVLDFLADQPEFKTPIWDYLAGLVDEERVSDGRAMLKQW